MNEPDTSKMSLEEEANRGDVWRAALGAGCSFLVGGCLLSPFILVFVSVVLGAAVWFLLWLRDLVF